jgi:hypothetical protein
LSPPSLRPLPPPAPPFKTWPIQVADPRFGYLWKTAPNIVITQASFPEVSEAVVGAFHDALDAVIQAEAKAIAEHGGLVMIHDWRALRGYDTAARRLFMARMKTRAPGYLKVAVVVVPDTPLLRMAVQTAELLLATGLGGSLRLVSDVEAALREYKVQRPR